MAKKIGTGATLYVNDGGGYVEVNNITNISMDLSADEADSTDNDDAGYKSNLFGNSQLTMSVDCNYDEQAGQVDVIEAYDGGTSCTWRYRIETTVGKKEYIFTSYVFGLTVPAANNTTTTMSFNLASDGALTIQDQT